ncbi:calcium-binding protein [Microvirga solisilvae]|uniref:calcium-binding protein n=1 Tax=Microvirga solisilvae TaxID=2919498 RepID=UPI001FAF2804|nr:calcium-binding protein [Microvirga solisilvae]
MATPVLWGSQFQINTTGAGFQTIPKVVTLPNGTSVVIWRDIQGSAETGVTESIRGQILNADGTKQGGEFTVNSTTGGTKFSPSIAVLNDGRFVVAWTDGSGAGGEQGLGIRARVFKMDGTPVDYDFRVNGSAADPAAMDQVAPSVTALANGGFAISYTDYFNGDGSGRGIKSQTYNASLEKIRDEVYVNGTTAGNQSGSISLGLKNGRQVIIYADESNSPDDASPYTVRARIIDAEGRPTPGVDDFVVPSSRDAKLQPSATLLKDGRFVVVWEHIGNRTGDGSEMCVKAQIFNEDGTPSGGEFVVNTTTAGRQMLPVVAATADGGFAVTFLDNSAGVAEKLDLRMTTFDAHGTRSGPDTIIATVKNGPFKGGLTTMADGRLMATWQSQEADGDLNVWGQIVDPRSGPVVYNGTAGNDQYGGTRWNDVLRGAGGNDRLIGDAGNDVLDGGTGNDVMNGGVGNDTYYVDSALDSIIDSSGVDTVVTYISYTLASFLENLTASGSSAISLAGNGASNVITGNAAANTIKAYGGNDKINGGYGNDKLYGGTGRDIFVFNTALHSSRNKDWIYDFVAKDDTIYLENAIFKALKKTGTLSKSFFTVGAKAADKDDYIGYNKLTGDVWYDANANKSGGQYFFANVGKNKGLTAADFVVI